MISQMTIDMFEALQHCRTEARFEQQKRIHQLLIELYSH